MSTSKIYERTIYDKNELPYVSNVITEYDLRKANISALRYYNIINDEDYNILLSMPKKVRELNIGMMIKKDISIFKHIKNGIIKAKELFFNINNIEDREVLSIKNDAIFLMGTRNIQCNVNELFTFVPKNTYTFYMKSMHLQIFYGYNQINNSEVLDIKGIKDIQLEYHRDYMVNFLCSLMYMIQNNTIEDTIQYYNNFYEQYINRKLPIGYYREFNATSKFKVGKYLLDHLDSSYINIIDINTNIYLLRDIFAVLSDIYFNNKNRR